MIYFDNSATTKPHTSVVKTYEQVAEKYFANPSSLHMLGAEAENLFIRARKQIADLLQVSDGEIIFTSGGTEGNNLAIKGIAFQHHQRGKHIITSQIEHASVFEACKSLESLGFEVTYLPVNEKGLIDVEDVERAIRPDTILVSIMHVNNELGSIQPIEEIGKMLQKYPKLYFHVDDVQGFGKVPLSIREYGIDLCTYSGHKIHGLKGTGVLYVNDRVRLYPLFHGGGQEAGRRSGTENLPGSIALAKSFRLAKAEQSQLKDLTNLRRYFYGQLETISSIKINSPKHAAPHIINISVPGIKPEILIHALGEQDIFISTKSACSSRDDDENRVLLACGHPEERSSSALRISLNYHNTKEEVDIVLQALEDAIDGLKIMME